MNEITPSVSKRPNEGHHYNAAILHVLKDYVCEWIDNRNDYYILCSCFLDQNFEPSTAIVPLGIVHDSNEKALCANLHKQIDISNLVDIEPSPDLL